MSDGQIVIQHGGGSAGHLAFIAFNKDYGTGVVILYNLGGNNIPWKSEKVYCRLPGNTSNKVGRKKNLTLANRIPGKTNCRKNMTGFKKEGFKMIKSISIVFTLLLLFNSCSTGIPESPIDSYQTFQVPDGNIQLIFSVTADVRYFCGDNLNWFRHVCERIRIGGRGNFMISPGDMDPSEKNYHTIQTYIGQDYVWYPVVGNHETEIKSNETEPQDMIWLRNFNQNGNILPNIVNTGPTGCTETTYSFDYGDVHFVVLNEYYNGFSDTGTDGDISESLYNWLVDDLTANKKPIILVFGHEPAYPQPDEENGRIRHEYDSLNQYPENRDRFWNVLVDFDVKAYICGHTHNYSSVNVDGVWQIDAGHARGTGDQGARSTFIMFYVMKNGVIWYCVYRLNLDQNRYELTSTRQIL